jgi:hypothetical protein
MGRFIAPGLAALFLLFGAPSSWSQTENAKLKVRAVLVDKDLNQKPVRSSHFRTSVDGLNTLGNINL